jgi:hypothetical protein
MRWALTAAALAAVVALLWIGGEQHRENCVRGHRTACSVLPWDSGDKAKRGSWVDQYAPKRRGFFDK